VSSARSSASARRIGFRDLPLDDTKGIAEQLRECKTSHAKARE
jgi:hypothetical protein